MGALHSDLSFFQKEDLAGYLQKAGILIFIILLAFFINKILTRAIRRADSKYEQLDSTVVPVLITLTRTAVSLIALMFILEALGGKCRQSCRSGGCRRTGHRVGPERHTLSYCRRYYDPSVKAL